MPHLKRCPDCDCLGARPVYVAPGYGYIECPVCGRRTGEHRVDVSKAEWNRRDPDSARAPAAKDCGIAGGSDRWERHSTHTG